MEPSSLLSGSDNLFKYLFTVGAVMIVTSIIYPLQKKQEIEIQINHLLKESELLNYEVVSLKKDYQGSKKEFKNVSDKLNSMYNVSGKVVKEHEQFLQLRRKNNELIQNLKSRYRELEIKNIIMQNEQSKIDLLKRHANSYNSYYQFVKWVGIFFLLSGLIGWVISTFIQEKMNWIGLIEKMPKKEITKPIQDVEVSKPEKKDKGDEK